MTYQHKRGAHRDRRTTAGTRLGVAATTVGLLAGWSGHPVLYATTAVLLTLTGIIIISQEET